MKERYWKQRKQLVIWLGIVTVFLALFLFIIVMAIQKQSEEIKVIPKDSEQLEMPLGNEKENVEKTDEKTERLQEESDAVQIHLEGYMKNIFNGWD